MSAMMVWSINLLVLAIGILVAGMIKPKWILFWMNNPSRIQIQLLAGALFMGATVLFGEANLAKQEEQVLAKKELTKVVEETPTIVAKEEEKK